MAKTRSHKHYNTPKRGAAAQANPVASGQAKSASKPKPSPKQKTVRFSAAKTSKAVKREPVENESRSHRRDSQRGRDSRRSSSSDHNFGLGSGYGPGFGLYGPYAVPSPSISSSISEFWSISAVQLANGISVEERKRKAISH